MFQVWEAEQNNAVQNLNGSAELAGDGRCDSPGFCAKFMTYTFMEVVTSKIIHFVQVQLGEVGLQFFVMLKAL